MNVSNGTPKLRRRKDSKACQAIMANQEKESKTYLASDLVMDDEGRVTDVKLTRLPRAKVLGMIPRFEDKHAHSVNKARNLGAKG